MYTEVPQYGANVSRTEPPTWLGGLALPGSLPASPAGRGPDRETGASGKTPPYGDRARGGASSPPPEKGPKPPPSLSLSLSLESRSPHAGETTPSFNSRSLFSSSPYSRRLETALYLSPPPGPSNFSKRFFPSKSPTQTVRLSVIFFGNLRVLYQYACAALMPSRLNIGRRVLLKIEENPPISGYRRKSRFWVGGAR